MKKAILLIVLIFIVYQGVIIFSDKMDEEFFDSSYQEMKDEQENEPNLWEKNKNVFRRTFSR